MTSSKRFVGVLQAALTSTVFASAVFGLAGCTTSPPRNPSDICSIFDEKSDWHESATESSQKWGSSIPVMMSMMYQESRFVADAKPAFRWFLFIPLGRPSSAYGYPQAKDDTWDWYQSSAGHTFASRDDFEDAIDFIGWYNAQTMSRNRVKPNDAYNLYLAYHEGQGGYQRGTYRNNRWLKNTARQVASRAASYDRQYAQCKKRLADADD